MKPPHVPADPTPGLSPEMAEVCLDAFLSSAPVSVYFKDHDSRFIEVSELKARRHGLMPSEMVGRSDADYFAADHAEWKLVDEESIMATGEPIIGKLEQLKWRDGRSDWAQTTKMPLLGDGGAIVGTFGMSYDVTEQQQITHDLEKTRRDLLDTSRLAGMAEVATGVLHNVGNVLTSLNVSANVLSTGLRYSKAESLAKIAALLEAHTGDLAAFITADPKGHRIPEFLDSLSRHMLEERERLLNELTALQQNIDHIKEIITMQQAWATTAGIVEDLDPQALVEDALRMNAGALIRHSVAVVREFHPSPRIHGEKAKVLQVLVNLIRNAKYAVDEGGGADKIITVRIAPSQEDHVRISIQDNGIGITAENMARLFQHGFTTRAKGHGFGLHSARQAAQELGGRLIAESAGPGMGATFILELPSVTAEITSARHPTAPAVERPR